MLPGLQRLTKLFRRDLRGKTADLQAEPGFAGIRAILDLADQNRLDDAAIHPLWIACAQVAPNRPHRRTVMQTRQFDHPVLFRRTRLIVPAHALVKHRQPFGREHLRSRAARRRSTAFAGQICALLHAPAQGIEQADIGAHIIHADALVFIQMAVIGALRIEQGQVIDRARGIHLAADLPRFAGRAYGFLLGIETLAGELNGRQGSFHFADGLVDGADVGFDHLFMDGLRNITLRAPPPAIENACGKTGQGIPEEGLRREQRTQVEAAVAHLRREIDTRQNARPRHIDIGIRRQHAGFDHAHIRPTQDQRRRQAGQDLGQLEGIHPRIREAQGPRHGPQLEGQRVQGLLALLFEHRHRGAHGKDGGTLLFHVGQRRIARLGPFLDGGQRGRQDRFRLLGDAQAIVQRDVFDITRRHTGHDATLNVVTFERSPPGLQGCRFRQGRLFAPDIQTPFATKATLIRFDRRSTPRPAAADRHPARGGTARRLDGHQTGRRERRQTSGRSLLRA